MENMKGLTASALSGMTFGLIPLFTLPLLGAGVNSGTVLAYRFIAAAVMMLPFMFLQKLSFKLTLKEFMFLFLLCMAYNGSAYFLFRAYNYLSSGVATSVQMVYPIIVMFIMIYVFKEKKSLTLFITAIMAVLGVAFLSYGEYTQGAQMIGVVLSLTGAACYALYIVVVNKSMIKDMDNIKLTFYVLLFCGISFMAASLAAKNLQPLAGGKVYFNILMLALVGTVVPNITLVYGIQRVGSVIVSIMGCLSPATAVVVGVIVFGEVITRMIFTGLFLVFSSALMVVFAGPIDGHFKGFVNRLTGHLGIKLK